MIWNSSCSDWLGYTLKRKLTNQENPLTHFTPIEVKDLPAEITEAIAKNFAESIVKEAAVEATEDGSKTYQVVLTDKEGTENTVFFNEKGEILK